MLHNVGENKCDTLAQTLRSFFIWGTSWFD